MRISDWSSDVCSSDLRLLDIIGQRVDLGDRLVEAQRLDVGGNHGDRAVELAGKRDVLAAVAGIFTLAEQAPQALDEAPRALDPRLAPRQVELGRAVGEHEPARRETGRAPV